MTRLWGLASLSFEGVPVPAVHSEMTAGDVRVGDIQAGWGREAQ